eukprot:TRINITY_DN502_c0_g1_i1.p1 TRINITY_DN502_c0_g1~~TRINITY_DN502_c0_g1_i1.p1  ORF type:complete len:176 (-),score=50.59 TRINITY_DN502_c0_g1_i1:294-821(-)
MSTGSHCRCTMELNQANLAQCFGLHGTVLFVTGCAQGFTVMIAKSPKLALTAHIKTIAHATTLLGLSSAIGNGAIGAEGMYARASQVLVIGGCWISLVGDVAASFTGVHLPLASQAAGAPAVCDPSEDDYSKAPAKRSKPKGAPALATVGMKISAIMVMVGIVPLLRGADWSKLY